MTTKEIQAKVMEYSEPELAQQTGSVYQLWSDGEITLQKSGSLLGLRFLHQIMPSIGSGINLVDFFPEKSHAGKYGFAYMTREHAEEIRNMMAQL